MIKQLSLALLIVAQVLGCDQSTPSNSKNNSRTQSQTSPNVSFGYKPPFLPITFSIDSDGNLSVGASATISTFLGDFSIGASYPLQQSPDYLHLVIRDAFHDNEKVYELRMSDDFTVEYDGKGKITKNGREIIIEAFTGTVRLVPFDGHAVVNDGNNPHAWSPGELVSYKCQYKGPEMTILQGDRREILRDGDRVKLFGTAGWDSKLNQKTISVVAVDEGGKQRTVTMPAGSHDLVPVEDMFYAILQSQGNPGKPEPSKPEIYKGSLKSAPIGSTVSASWTNTMGKPVIMYFEGARTVVRDGQTVNVIGKIVRSEHSNKIVIRVDGEPGLLGEHYEFDIPE